MLFVTSFVELDINCQIKIAAVTYVSAPIPTKIDYLLAFMHKFFGYISSFALTLYLLALT